MAVRFGRAINYMPKKLKRADGTWRENPIFGWKDCIQAFAGALKPRLPIEGPVRVDLTFYFPRPKSHYKTSKMDWILKGDAPVHCASKPDRDNCDKAILDVLTELQFWQDDAQVCDGRIIKRYGPAVFPNGEKHNGCYVRIRECQTETKGLL